MTDLFQSALDLDVQEESQLSDFRSMGYQAVVIAAQKLCQGELSEIFIYGKKVLVSPILLLPFTMNIPQQAKLPSAYHLTK